jgi:signal transduction histidine kinase
MVARFQSMTVSKYTPDGGRIVVEMRHDEAEIVVSISDTGVGIPPEMLEQVFELFSQVERSSHRTRGGLGIGLTLAKGLAEGSTSP